MAELPPVPQVLRADVTWHVDGDPAALTRLFLRYAGGPPSSAQCATMGASIVAGGSTAFSSLTVTTVGMSSCEVTDLTSPTSGQGAGGAQWSGADATNRLSPGACALFSHSIARRYRGGKPRHYLPIGDSSFVASTGLWTSSAVTGFNSAWSTWVTAILGSGAGCSITNLVNVSYYQGFTNVPYGSPTKYRRVPTPRDVPVVDNITATVCKANIGSQRRRNRRA